jgi:hypothetical protein
VEKSAAKVRSLESMAAGAETSWSKGVWNHRFFQSDGLKI